MKVTKRQLQAIIQEEMLQENPAMRARMHSGSRVSTGGGSGGVPKKSRDSIVKELRPQLDAALESGKTKGIPQGWIDNHNSSNKDPKFSLYTPESFGGPTDEELLALSKALNPSIFGKLKRMIGLSESGKMVTKGQLRRIIREEKARILRESMEELPPPGAGRKPSVSTDVSILVDQIEFAVQEGLEEMGVTAEQADEIIRQLYNRPDMLKEALANGLYDYKKKLN